MVITSPILEVGQTFLAALSERDFEQLQASFQKDVEFRALVQNGTRVASSAAEAVAWLRRWFDAADEFQMQSSSVDQVADRLHIAYRFQVYAKREWQIIEQQAYCTISEGRISTMNLVSSDFLSDLQPESDVLVGTFYNRGV